jgi:hypothetical protein
MLNSHPQVLGYGEIFRDTDRIGWDLAPPGRDDQSSTLVRQLQSAPIAFLEAQVLGNPPPGIRAVGFKLFYYHAQDGERRNLWEYLANRPGLFVIHLKRRNTLREWLSIRRAEQTGDWSRWNAIERPVEPITLSIESCRREFEYARVAKERADALFAGQPMLQVGYEELVRNRAVEMARVQRFLGVDVDEPATSIVRQSRGSLAEAIANYAELEHAFRDTEWAVFFDDSS